MNTHRRHYFDSTDCIIGIDPGSNGGIATWRPEHPVLTSKMPRDLNDLREYLQYVKSVCAQPIVFLEKVQLRADDIKDNPGKAFRIQQLLMQFQKLKDYIGRRQRGPGASGRAKEEKHAQLRGRTEEI